MQQIGLSAIVFALLAGATAFVVWRLANGGHRSLAIQAMLGAPMGLLGLLVVLVLVLDFVPDDIEAQLAMGSAVGVTVIVVVVALTGFARR